MQTKVLPFSLKASGWFLSHLGRPFPGLAARVFFHLFSEPPRKKGKGSQLAARDKAKAGVVHLSKYAFDPGLLKIATYCWSDSRTACGPANKVSGAVAPRKKVLLMHGWGGTALGFQALVDELAGAGYEVVAFDAPAHGYSEGKRTNLVQWVHVLDQFLRQQGPFYAIVGHSAGALVTTLTLARKGIEAPKLVLAAPALSAPSFFQDTFELFKIRLNVIAKVYRLVETKLRDDLLTMDLHHCIDRMRRGQVLLVYDERDALMKHGEISSFLEECPGIGSCKIQGEGHFRILRNPEVIRRILAFLG